MITHEISPEIHFGVSNIVELLQRRACKQPDKRAYTFLVDGETQEVHITYAKLDKKARAIAAYLQSVASSGERALLLYPQGLDFSAAFFGCLYAGIVAVPANPPRRNSKSVRLTSLVTDAEPALVLTTESLLSVVESQLSEKSEFKETKWITTDSVDDSLAKNCQPALIQSETLAFLQYTSGSTGIPKGVMVSHGNIIQNAEYVKHSLELSEEGISVTWLPCFHDMGLMNGIIEPLYAGCLSILMPPGVFIQKPIRWLKAISRYGATHAGGPNMGYELCTQKIALDQCTTLDLSKWKSAYSGAEPIQQKTIEAFSRKFAACGFQSRYFYPCYGMAEATLMISGGSVDSEPAYLSVDANELKHHCIVESPAEEAESKTKNLVGCGHSRLQTRILIVDPSTQHRCGPGQVGEIWVFGPSVAKGYWRRPEQSIKTFQAYLSVPEGDAAEGDIAGATAEGPFLRTGDLGFLQGDELFVTGRIKDLIILWGRNHYPQDIELTMSQSHPALRPDCGAAFSVEIGGVEKLVVFQEIKRMSLRQLNVDEAVKAIRQAISEQHDLQVHEIVLLKTASIPKTSSGKIQRSTCKANYLASELNIVGNWKNLLEQTALDLPFEKKQAVQPEGTDQALNKSDGLKASSEPITEASIENWLVERMAHITNIPPDEIDIEESFAQYGLDSSVAMSITGELANWLEVELQPTLFWEYPNIEASTQYLIELFNNSSRR